MTPLERGQLTVMRVHAGFNALVLLAAAFVAEVALQARTNVPLGIVIGPLVVLLIYAVGIAPARRYRAWGYSEGEDELRVAHGVWTRIETHVPLARVQHIDVSQGPIERSASVCRLILHTAGTADSRVVLPGLSRATAERLRDEVRALIRREEV